MEMKKEDRITKDIKIIKVKDYAVSNDTIIVESIEDLTILVPEFIFDAKDCYFCFDSGMMFIYNKK